ncbi:unnamed protein product [Brassicogethes aeneus]|uniref:Uncharacterized protein n=1 Tax=Brassicogethes aeneus TaxID=1431903 RepID=A0A9P0BA44_BRAAE|nr:unnamed protein product [Brassicogethes aeneus]
MDTNLTATTTPATVPAENAATSSYVPPSKEQPDQSNPPGQQNQDQPNPTNQIPPIILRTKDRWTMVSKELKKKGWHFSKAVNIPEGVKFFPDTVDSFRAISKFLQNNGEQFHTYMLPEDKLLQVVIRGFPQEIDIKEVVSEIKERGFHPQSAIRMKTGAERKLSRRSPLLDKE